MSGVLRTLEGAASGLFLATGSMVAMVPMLVLYPILPRRRYATLTASLQQEFLTVLVLLVERHKKLRIYFSGDAPPPPKEAALVLPNHAAAHGDWAPLFSLAARQGGGMLGAVKTVIKDVAKWIPGFGWTMYLANWPFLKRKWTEDKSYLQKKLQTYAELDHLPLQIWLFPEGTRWTKKKHAAAVKFARERKLCGGWIPEYTMVPRVKGFVALVKGLRGVVSHVYDITLAYTGFALKPGSKGPGMAAIFAPKVAAECKECAFHVHVRRLKLSSLPEDEDELKKTLYEWFQAKDNLLQEFHKSSEREDSRRFVGAKAASPLSTLLWLLPLCKVTFANFGVLACALGYFPWIKFLSICTFVTLITNTGFL